MDEWRKRGETTTTRSPLGIQWRVPKKRFFPAVANKDYQDVRTSWFEPMSYVNERSKLVLVCFPKKKETHIVQSREEQKISSHSFMGPAPAIGPTKKYNERCGHRRKDLVYVRPSKVPLICVQRYRPTDDATKKSRRRELRDKWKRKTFDRSIRGI